MGSDLTPLQLTDFERRFVRAISRGSSVVDSIIKAGYRNPDPESAAFELARKEHVTAALVIEAKRALSIGAIGAARYLVGVVDGVEKPNGVRVQAANSLLDRAGIVAPRDAPRDPADLGAATIEELHSLVDKLARNRGDKARDVTPLRGVIQQASDPASAKPIDIYA